MFYSIRHLTHFRYDLPVSESLMELRMHPRTEGAQRCLSFQLSVDPRAQVDFYRDYLGNNVHHFDVPGNIRNFASSPRRWWSSTPDPLPPRLDADGWDAARRAGGRRRLLGNAAAQPVRAPNDALPSLIDDLQVERRDDPLCFLRGAERRHL